MMENLNLLKLRAKHANNDRQRDRMVQDKLRSLHRALLYSYQTAWIKKDGVEDAAYVRALINPDKVKFDYDEKIVSVEFAHGFSPGDTFEWKNTGTHWPVPAFGDWPWPFAYFGACPHFRTSFLLLALLAVGASPPLLPIREI